MIRTRDGEARAASFREAHDAILGKLRQCAEAGVADMATGVLCALNEVDRLAAPPAPRPLGGCILDRGECSTPDECEREKRCALLAPPATREAALPTKEEP